MNQIGVCAFTAISASFSTCLSSSVGGVQTSHFPRSAPDSESDFKKTSSTPLGTTCTRSGGVLKIFVINDASNGVMAMHASASRYEPQPKVRRIASGATGRTAFKIIRCKKRAHAGRAPTPDIKGDI